MEVDSSSGIVTFPFVRVVWASTEAGIMSGVDLVLGRTGGPRSIGV